MKFSMEESIRDAKEENHWEGTTVLIGIKMDDASRQLLAWALMNVAQTGDRVIAIHVLKPDMSNSDGEPSSLTSILNALNTELAVYEVFCSLKQIDLKLQISRGSSVRRVLTQVASSVSASKVVVGVSNYTSDSLSYSSISIAKYCVKKLSSGCLVLAVDNGKIIFQKETSGAKNIDALFLGRDFARSCKFIEPLGKDADSASFFFHCLPTACKTRLNSDRINSYAAKLFLRFNSLKNQDCASHDSLSEPLCSPASDVLCQGSSDCGEESFNAASTKDNGRSGGCVPISFWELPSRRPGWHFHLRRTFLCQKDCLQSNQKASVFKLAMQLSSWTSAFSAVHPDRKQAKSDAFSGSGSDGEAPLIPTFGSDDDKKNLSEEFIPVFEKYLSFFRLFNNKELKLATSNFSPENIIGTGGNSRVYKGCFNNGKELAVKVLEPSDDALKTFISEIEIMSKLHHKNIISLTGFCIENKNHVLVYDFLSRGSLEDNLHGNKGAKNSPGWTERCKIAVGIAEALECLHENIGTQPVIHRDVKSSNILLSDEFEPQLSDFGLAQIASKCIINEAPIDLAGTFGYLAPECFAYSEIDEKVDVYAFGVVLLELLSGRKPVCTDCLKGQESLVLWAKPMLRGWKLEQVLDSRLGRNYNTYEMERMCIAAFLCIRQLPGNRPSMALVVKLIKGDEGALEWAKMEFGASILLDGMVDEAAAKKLSIQSHINLALQGIDDEAAFSMNSRAQSFDFITSSLSLE